MNNSDKIASIALVVSMISAIFAGMTYYSDQASKRDEIGIFVLDKQYSMSFNNLTSTYDTIFAISGVLTNEGPRRCQINQFVFQVTLPLSEILKEYYNISSSAKFNNFQETCISGTSNVFGWENNIFDVGSQRNFTTNMLISTWKILSLKSNDVQGNIHLQYDDVLGTLSKDQSISDWIQVS